MTNSAHRLLASIQPEACQYAEEEVLSGCRHGHAWAWSELHRRYRPVALGFLRKLGVAESEIDDCVQDSFLELYRHLEGFRNEARFKTWFYRICASQARRARRRAQVTRAMQDPALSMNACGVVTLPSFSEACALRSIREASERLSPVLRAAFELFDMQGLSGRSIAALLRCPEATVWRRLHEARKAITAVFLGEPPPSGALTGSSEGRRPLLL